MVTGLEVLEVFFLSEYSAHDFPGLLTVHIIIMLHYTP